MRIRVGVQLHPQHCTYPQLAEAAQRTDQLGFDTLWTWDHFFPLYGSEGAPMGEALPPEAGDPPQRGDHFEGWTLLSAFACLTKTVEIGMMVTCNSYRNPQLLADMYRTCDHISNGRMILGMGSGWFERDYAEYGYEFGTAVSRLKDLQASLPVIKNRLAQLTPPPVRQPVPMIIGGGGEKITLRLVAEHATMWNYFADPEGMKHKISVLNGWCEKIGRNPDEIEKTILMTGPDFLDKLDAYYEVGVTHFICGMGVPFHFGLAEKLLKWRDERNKAGA
jgi:probable F420-dependent oxidoreductase